MEDNMLSDVILGALAVLLVLSVVLIPLGLFVFYLAYGKKHYETIQREQQSTRDEARERLIKKGVVKSDKWC